MASRNYCFTINNPESLLDFSAVDCVRYAIYQEEVGENGTLHFQGYLELDRAQRRSFVSNIPGLERAHLEVRRGTRDQARAYCTKEDTRVGGPYEYGNWEDGGQGTRSDIVGLKRMLDEGATEEQIADQHFSLWMRNFRALREYARVKSKKRDFKTEVYLFYGPTGTGKSSAVRDMSPNAYWKSRSNWWDGYNGTDDVVLDDFYGWLPYDFMLRLMDRYPLTAEIKGAMVELRPKRIFITSNKLPWEWWNPENVPFNRDAFMRRVDKVYYAMDDRTEIYVGSEIQNFLLKF